VAKAISLWTLNNKPLYGFPNLLNQKPKATVMRKPMVGLRSLDAISILISS
jgi:hypothetical protein